MNSDTNATIAASGSSSENTENIVPPQPPVARRQPVQSILHGDTRIDEYAWLRHKEDPEVLAYLNAENGYADALLEQTSVLQEKLYQEMLGRIQQTDLSVPYRLRGYLYFTRTEEGKQYSLHCRRIDNDDAPEQVLLDLNALAQGHSFLGLGSFTVSDDNQLLAFALDTNGYRQFTLQIKDLATNETLPARIERVTSAAWAADNRTLFYTVEDEITKRSHHLYRHTVGAAEPDTLIYDEPDERFRIEISRTRSGAYLLLTIASHTTSEVHFLPASRPSANFKLIAPREDSHEYYVDHHSALPNANDPSATPTADASAGTFFIRTNSAGRTFRLMTVSPDDARRKFWREFISNRPNVMLAAADVFQSHLVLFERENGLPYLRVVDLAQATANVAAKYDALAASHRVEFTEPTYSASLGANPEFSTHTVRFLYESFITPRSVFDYYPQTRHRTLLKEQPVLGDYDPSQYVSERLHAIAPDGTRIPISLVSRRNTPRDGSPALLLYGYGSYSISIPVSFNSNRLSLLDRGITFAIAHIRGGGELGKPWHDAGRMHNKRNTFTDFIAAAEHLIAQRYTSPDRLIIEGGSAGGLLMGAVANLRPDLFRIVISHVPFVDVLNTMLDPSLPLTVGEYEEWGNPQVAADYAYMRTYCPYTNLERKHYPTMLVKTGLNDSQVMYWEPVKYVAKLRTLKADSNPLLLKINMGAGHGGASGRYDYLREIALDYAFLLTQLGIQE
jgi:oligopeptidase B